MRPLTGITCNYDPKDEIGTISHMGQPEQQWLFLAEDYIASVEMAGGIQWHPEMMTDSEEQQKIFQAFISACKKERKMNTICTCKNTKCPLHPDNHDKGCTPCISKNLKHHEEQYYWTKICGISGN